MSSNLEWHPYPTKGKGLPDDLKYALRKRYGDSVNAVLGESDLQYLQGLRDGGLTSAQLLIDAIEKHGEIEVQEKY